MAGALEHADDEQAKRHARVLQRRLLQAEASRRASKNEQRLMFSRAMKTNNDSDRGMYDDVRRRKVRMCECPVDDATGHLLSSS